MPVDDQLRRRVAHPFGVFVAALPNVSKTTQILADRSLLSGVPRDRTTRLKLLSLYSLTVGSFSLRLVNKIKRSRPLVCQAICGRKPCLFNANVHDSHLLHRYLFGVLSCVQPLCFLSSLSLTFLLSVPVSSSNITWFGTHSLSEQRCSAQE